MNAPVLKPGRKVLDPLNRVVTIVRAGEDASGAFVEVQLAGPYAATVRYSASMLRSLE